MDLGRIGQENIQLMHLLMEYFRLGIVNYKLLEFFCDLTKAFNCVNHDILIEKLKFMGLMKQALNGLSPIYTTEDKELTSMLIMFKITPSHGK